MELKLIGEKGAARAAGTMSAKDEMFGRDFNEALVHQIVVAYAGECAHRLAQQAEGSRRGAPLDQEALAPEGHRPRARRHDLQPAVARRRQDLSRTRADENYSQKVNRKMYRAGMASILSQLAREDRIRVVEEFKVEQPKTKLLAQKVKSMGFDEVLVITDEVDQQPACCRRATCATCR